MRQVPRIGLSGEQVITVGPENRISFVDARMPAVLATPWLIAHLEYAARVTLWQAASRITSEVWAPRSKSSIWPLRRRGSP